jgi:hypothetical protein
MIEGWGKYRIPGEEQENILFLKGERANNSLFLNAARGKFPVPEQGKEKNPLCHRKGK